MHERKIPAPSAPPKLPWFGTVILLVVVLVAALIRPFVPHGIAEYALRLTGRPLSLDIGRDRSIRLVEEPAMKTNCQVSDLRWTADGTALVVECPMSLQAWAPDGHLIGSVSVGSGWPQKHMQVLANPFRVVYLGKAGDPSVNEAVLMTWDVQHDRTSAGLMQPSEIDNFLVDLDQRRVAVVGARGPDRDIRLLSMDDGQVTQTIHAQSGTWSLRWVPRTQALLLGSYDGVLRLADVATGDLRELARPYTTKFPSGGGVFGSVDGLMLAPDGKSVAIFMTGGGIYPTPGTNTVDQAAERQWRETLSTTVEIRSIEDGRLLHRMAGPEAGAIDLAWDPRDRFIAVAGLDALFLWQRQNGAQAVMTYDNPGKLSINDDGTQLALATGNGLRIFRIEEIGRVAGDLQDSPR